MKNKDKALFILKALLLMAIVQLIRIGLQKPITNLFPSDMFGRKMTAMTAMTVLTPLFYIFARYRKVDLKLFPEKFTKGYIITTVLALALYISTPANYIIGFTAIMELIYGVIVTPAFEELIFRGYLFSREEEAFTKKTTVFIVNVVFFTVWHVFYMLPQLFEGNFVAVFWKMAAGVCYGVILALIRQKSGNCYLGFLAHGILNLFMV